MIENSFARISVLGSLRFSGSSQSGCARPDKGQSSQKAVKIRTFERFVAKKAFDRSGPNIAYSSGSAAVKQREKAAKG
jgi:hypothetical protein